MCVRVIYNNFIINEKKLWLLVETKEADFWVRFSYVVGMSV